MTRTNIPTEISAHVAKSYAASRSGSRFGPSRPLATLVLAVVGLTGLAATVAAEPPTDSVPVVTEKKPGTAFLKKSAIGSMLEIKLGELAKTKGTSADVKEFGEKMVTDHTKALSDIRALASAKDITLPTEDQEEAKKEIDKEVAKFSSLSGEKFDKAYIRNMVDDHEKDIAEAKSAAEHNKDKDLRELATKLQTTYEEHLKHAKKIHKKLKD